MHNDKEAGETESAFSVWGVRQRGFLLLVLGIFLYIGMEKTIANFADSFFELSLNAPKMSVFALALFWGFIAGVVRVLCIDRRHAYT